MLEVAGNEQLPVAQARAGESTAWDALFRRYQLPLYVYVRELVRDEQTSLDLVQETFVNATRHLRSLREDAKFGSWLFGIAHQKCVQHWRRRQVAERVFSDEPVPLEDFPEAGDSPDEWLVRREQEEELMRLIEQLPAVQRSALLLHFLEEFPLEEIAQITGTQLGTVKSRLHYAKKALRKLLEERTP
jgi:RNA polymerase sigma-70 factor, ECF subfamily